MDLREVLSAAESLSIDDRIRLVEAVWDGIAAEQSAIELTDAQKGELERRIAAYEASPQNVVPWEQVEAEARARTRG